MAYIEAAIRNAEPYIISSPPFLPREQLSMYLHRMQGSLSNDDYFPDVLRLTADGKRNLIEALEMTCDATEDDDRSIDLDVTFDGPYGYVSMAQSEKKLCTLDFAICFVVRNSDSSYSPPRALPRSISDIINQEKQVEPQLQYFALTKTMPTMIGTSVCAYLYTFSRITSRLELTYDKQSWVHRFRRAFRHDYYDGESDEGEEKDLYYSSAYGDAAVQVARWIKSRCYEMWYDDALQTLVRIARIGAASAERNVNHLLSELVCENKCNVKCLALLHAVITSIISTEEENAFSSSTSYNTSKRDDCTEINALSQGSRFILKRGRRNTSVEDMDIMETNKDVYRRLEDVTVEYITELLLRNHAFKSGMLKQMVGRDHARMPAISILLSVFRSSASKAINSDDVKSEEEPWKLDDDALITALKGKMCNGSRSFTDKDYADCLSTLCSLFSDSAMVHDIASEAPIDSFGNLAKSDPLLCEALKRLNPAPERRMILLYDLAASRNENVEMYMNMFANRTDPVDAYMLSLLIDAARSLSDGSNTFISDEDYTRAIFYDRAISRIWVDLHCRVLRMQRDRTNNMMRMANWALVDTLQGRDEGCCKEVDGYNIRESIWNRYVTLLGTVPNLLSSDGDGVLIVDNTETVAYVHVTSNNSMTAHVYDAKSKTITSVMSYHKSIDGTSGISQQWLQIPCSSLETHMQVCGS